MKDWLISTINVLELPWYVTYSTGTSYVSSYAEKWKLYFRQCADSTGKFLLYTEFHDWFKYRSMIHILNFMMHYCLSHYGISLMWSIPEPVSISCTVFNFSLRILDAFGIDLLSSMRSTGKSFLNYIKIDEIYSIHRSLGFFVISIFPMLQRLYLKISRLCHIL